MVVVDTPVWSWALGRNVRPLPPREQQFVVEFADLARQGRVKLLGVVRQEVLSGIRNREQYERLRQVLRGFPDALLDTEDYEMAAHATNMSLAAGITASAVDFLICAVTMRRGWAIYSPDRDFHLLARQLPISFHSPAPRRRPRQ